MAASSHGRQSPEVFTRVLLVWSQVMTVWYLRLQWRSILARMETLQSMSPYTRPIIRIIITTTRIWLYVKCVLSLSTIQYEGHVQVPEQCFSLGNNMHKIEGYATVSFSIVSLPRFKRGSWRYSDTGSFKQTNGAWRQRLWWVWHLLTLGFLKVHIAVTVYSDYTLLENISGTTRNLGFK